MSSSPPEVTKNIRRNNILVMDALINFSETTTNILIGMMDKTIEYLQQGMSDWIKKLYEEWSEFLITNYKSLKPTDIDENSRAMDIMWVLFGAKFILSFNQIHDEVSELEKKNIMSDDNFIISKKIEYVDLDKKILSYNQTNIMEAFTYLSERIDVVKYEELEELRSIFNVVHIRTCIFFCQNHTPNVLDIMSMRDDLGDDLYHVNTNFKAYCSIYVHSIQRRFFYYDLLHSNFEVNFPKNIDKIGPFFAETVKNFLGEESIFDTYIDACNEAYTYPGDAEWGDYMYPDMNMNTGELIQCLRPSLTNLYYTEDDVKIDRIFEGIGDELNPQKCKNCAMFVLNALSKYIAVHSNVIDWKTCVVISNEALSSTNAQIKIMNFKFPLIIQYTSRYWVYNLHNGKVKIYTTDSIYETVTMWLLILKIFHKSTLLGEDLTDIIDTII